MINQLPTSTLGRTDICISLSDQHLANLLKSRQPVFLLAEVGMEQEIIAVAEALAAQMADGGTLEVFNVFVPSPLGTEQLQAVEHAIAATLAGIQYNLPTPPDTQNPSQADCSTKPLFFQNFNLLIPMIQDYIVSCIHNKKVSILSSDGSPTLYDIRPWLIISAIYNPLHFQQSNGQLFNYLNGVNYLNGGMHTGLIDICLPGLIKVHPLRKAVDFMDSYIESYLNSLKSSRNATDAPDGEPRIDPEAIEALKAYSWPGNYDELRIVLRRAFIFAAGERVSAQDVEEALEGFSSDEKVAEPALKYDVPQKFSLDEVMKSTEAHLIKQILKKAKTQKEAAEILGFNSPQAFADRLRKLKIDLPAHLKQKLHVKNQE